MQSVPAQQKSLRRSPEYANLKWKRGSSDAWINEFHYDNKGKYQNEFLEVVVGLPADVARFEVVLYNGASGKMYRSLSLDDHQVFSLSNRDSTFHIYTACMPLQNGPSDGTASISTKNRKQPEVIQLRQPTVLPQELNLQTSNCKSQKRHLQNVIPLV